MIKTYSLRYLQAALFRTDVTGLWSKLSAELVHQAKSKMAPVGDIASGLLTGLA